MISRAHHDDARHRVRLLASVAAVLLALVLLVRLWPVSPPEPPRPLPPGPDRIVTIEEIVSTTQAAAASTSPPPPDLPPVEVEDVEIPEEPVVLDVPELTASPVLGPPSPEPPGDDSTTQRAPASGGVTRAPRSVSPVLPPIRRGDPRVELVVEVRVEINGRVSEARIVERFEIGRNDRREPVASVEARLEAEALQLAKQWRFRPALLNGEKVPQTVSIVLGWGTR